MAKVFRCRGNFVVNVYTEDCEKPLLLLGGIGKSTWSPTTIFERTPIELSSFPGNIANEFPLLKLLVLYIGFKGITTSVGLCTRLTCRTRLSFLEQRKAQWGQWKGFSPVWVSKCLRRSACWQKHLPQYWQGDTLDPPAARAVETPKRGETTLPSLGDGWSRWDEDVNIELCCCWWSCDRLDDLSWLWRCWSRGGRPLDRPTNRVDT